MPQLNPERSPMSSFADSLGALGRLSSERQVGSSSNKHYVVFNKNADSFEISSKKNWKGDTSVKEVVEKINQLVNKIDLNSSNAEDVSSLNNLELGLRNIQTRIENKKNATFAPINSFIRTLLQLTFSRSFSQINSYKEIDQQIKKALDDINLKKVDLKKNLIEEEKRINSQIAKLESEVLALNPDGEHLGMLRVRLENKKKKNNLELEPLKKKEKSVGTKGEKKESKGYISRATSFMTGKETPIAKSERLTAELVNIETDLKKLSELEGKLRGLPEAKEKLSSLRSQLNLLSKVNVDVEEIVPENAQGEGARAVTMMDVTPKGGISEGELDRSLPNVKKIIGTDVSAVGKLMHKEMARKAMFGIGIGQEMQREELKDKLEEGNKLRGELEELLEGAINMFYFAHLMEKNPTQKKDPDYVKGFERLHSDLVRSSSFVLSKRHFDIVARKNPEQVVENYQKLAEDIQDELKRMKPGERLLIPAGSADHAVLLSLCKTADGQVKTTFYNTGEGLEYLEKGGVRGVMDTAGQVFLRRKEVHTSLIYGPHDVGNENLINVLKEMFMHTGKAEDMDTVMPTLKKLGKNPKHGDKENPQKNETCSFHSLTIGFGDILTDGVKDEKKASKIRNAFQYDLLTAIKADYRKAYKEVKPRTDEAYLKDLMVTETETLLEKLEKQAVN